MNEFNKPTPLFEIAADGDVVVNELSDQQAPAPETLDRSDVSEGHKPDFSKRNSTLAQLASEVGQAKMYDGAAKSIYFGRHIGKYQSYEQAANLAEEAWYHAEILGSQACASCALRDECELKVSQLVTGLKDQGIRSRFRDRIRNPENDQFCEVNMQPRKKGQS